MGVPPRQRREWPDRGYATAELAVALPSLVLVLLAAVWILSAVSAQARCIEAARLGTRAAARGDADAAVQTRAAAAVPPGARVQMTHAGDLVEVRVQVVLHPLGALAAVVPSVTLTGAAAAPREELPP